jgi:hypothetical protein
LNRMSSVASHESEMALAKSMGSWHDMSKSMGLQHLYWNLAPPCWCFHLLGCLVIHIDHLNWWRTCLKMLQLFYNPHHASAPHEYISLVEGYMHVSMYIQSHNRPCSS